MADDDKKPFWSSLPGILSGLAAVLAAVGALIYHNHKKPMPAPTPVSAAVQQVANSPGAPPKPSTNDLAPPRVSRNSLPIAEIVPTRLPEVPAFAFVTATCGSCRM